MGEAKALYEKGVWHYTRWHTNKAIEAYDELIERFHSADEPALRELVVKSLYRTATAHAMRRRTKEAVAVWEGLANRYKSVTDPAICDLAARALYMKARSLIGTNEEIATYDEVISLFGFDRGRRACFWVALALIAKGFTVGELGREDEAIAAYDLVVDRFGQMSEVVLSRQVAKALLFKGLTLGRLGDEGGAIAAFEDVITRCQNPVGGCRPWRSRRKSVPLYKRRARVFPAWMANTRSSTGAARISHPDGL